MNRDGHFSLNRLSGITAEAEPVMQDQNPSHQHQHSAIVPVGGGQMMPPPGGALQPWQMVQPQMVPIYVQMPQPMAAPVAAAKQEDSIVLSLADVISYLRRHWGKGVLLAIPMAALTFAYLGLGKPVFEAESKVLVSIQEMRAVDFGQQGTGLTELSADKIINNHKSGITSRRYIDFLFKQLAKDQRGLLDGFLEDAGKLGMKGRLMLQLGLSDPPKATPPEELFATKLIASVRADNVKDTHLLRIAIRDSDPTRAAAVANEYAKGYVSYLINDAAQASDSTTQALLKERDELIIRLQEANAQVDQFQQKADLIKAGTGGAGLSTQRAESLSKVLNETEVTTTILEAELSQLRAARGAGMTGVIPGIGSDPIIVELRKQSADTQSKLAEWSQSCGKNHPKIIGFRQDLATNQQRQNERVDEIIQEKDNMLLANRDKAEKLRLEANTARNMARNEDTKSSQQGLLLDGAKRIQELLSQVNQRIEQTDVTRKLGTGGQVSVSDIAVPPEGAISPKKSIAAVAAMMVFGLIGGGLPMGLGFLQDKILPHLKGATTKAKPNAPAPHSAGSGLPGTQPAHPVQQAPSFQQMPVGMPMPGPVPMAGFPGMQMPQQHPMVHTSAPAPSTGTPPILAHIPELFSSEPAMQFTELLHADPMGGPSVIASICRTLEQQRRAVSGPRVVLITSATAGEGKSIVAASMAASLCTSGARVFLMECNPAAPSLVDWFPQSEHFSAMSSSLSALRYGLSNLYILPGHDLPTIDVGELLPGYRHWMSQASREVEWIIIDAASLLMGFADVSKLVPFASDILFVHDDTRCTHDQVKAAFNLLRPLAHADTLRGMIMNRHSLVTA
jgi:uncharacterized protein involved in exopolysaccharide biosynthesis/Mrp family chromosome partitioning ATPase